MNKFLRAIKRIGQRGAFATEFAIVIPLLTIMSLTTVESSLIFHHAQKISGLSREVANRVNRECITLEGKEMSQCIADVIDYMTFLGNRVLGQFGTSTDKIRKGSITVNVWKDPTPPLPDKDPDNSAPQQVGFGSSMNAGAAKLRTSFGTGKGTQFEGDFKRLLNLKGTLVVAEVYYEYTPKSFMGPLMKKFLRRDPVTGEGMIYEATIF